MVTVSPFFGPPDAGVFRIFDMIARWLRHDASNVAFARSPSGRSSLRHSRNDDVELALLELTLVMQRHEGN